MTICVPFAMKYTELLDATAEHLTASGEVSRAYAHLLFEERYVALLNEYPWLYRYLNISLPLSNDTVAPDECRVHAGPAMFGLLRHPKLLDVAETLIGSEIYSNPVQHIRLKPPVDAIPAEVADYSNIGAAWWHQDHGAVMDEAADTEMLTVWIAVNEATAENGCLVCIPRSHLMAGLTMHCPGHNIAAENYIPGSSSRQRSDPSAPRETRDSRVVEQIHRARFARQSFENRALELRSPLSAHRSTHREASVSGLRGTESGASRDGASRSGGLGSAVGGRPRSLSPDRSRGGAGCGVGVRENALLGWGDTVGVEPARSRGGGHF